MTILKIQNTKDISEYFTSESISEQELALVFGGKRRKPKSRDRDVIDVDDED